MSHRIPTGKYGNYLFNEVLLAVKMEFPQNNFSFDLNELRLMRNWYYSCRDFGLRERSSELIAKIERIIKKITEQIKEAII